MPSKKDTLATESIQEPIPEERTLLTESVHEKNDLCLSPRVSLNSQETLLSDLLPPMSEPVSDSGEESSLIQETIIFDDIQNADSDLTELLTEEEL